MLPLALAYGAGIIAIFVAIALIVGPGILRFANHPITNLVIGLTFSIGATLYVLALTPILITVDWQAISGFSWMMMLTSALLALNLSYWIWYTGLKTLGGSRTSVYSYLTPVVAMIVAAVWLAEPISTNQIAGAGFIFTGLLITRFVH